MSVDRILRGAVTPDDENAVQDIWMMLHGWYGNLLLSKFQTGMDDDGDGEDDGIANARRTWAYALRGYDADTIMAALDACKRVHLEFPPSLPQFQALCEARRPRGVSKSSHPANRLGMSEELRGAHSSRVRRENLARAAQALVDRTGHVEFMPGLAGLKQAISSAVGACGGDEAAELVRLDRLLTPRSAPRVGA